MEPSRPPSAPLDAALLAKVGLAEVTLRQLSVTITHATTVVDMTPLASETAVKVADKTYAEPVREIAKTGRFQFTYGTSLCGVLVLACIFTKQEPYVTALSFAALAAVAYPSVSIQRQVSAALAKALGRIPGGKSPE